MARWTPWFAIASLLASAGFAQPPVGGPSVVDVERAQQRALRARLMARRPRVAPPPSRDPRLEAAIRRLRQAGLDRLGGPDWRPPAGRGHRYGADLAERPNIIAVDANRHLTREGRFSFDHDPGYVWALQQAEGIRRAAEGRSRETPVALWVDPSLPSEMVWTLAWILRGQASEVQLVVSRGRVRPPIEASPSLAARLEACERELATGADPVCLEELSREALEGCPVFAVTRFRRHPYDTVLDPSGLYEECGPQPLLDPARFEAIWRFWLYQRAPFDTEYLIVDPERPPPASARTVQQWVRHLMREQLD